MEGESGDVGPDRPGSPLCYLDVHFLGLISELHSPLCPVDGNNVLKMLLHPYFDRRKHWCHRHDGCARFPRIIYQ